MIVACVTAVLCAGQGNASASQAEEWFRQGYMAAMAREWDEAINWYNKALERNPKNPEAHFQRAVTFEMTERPEAAIADYERALQLKPDYYLAMEYLAKLYETRGEYDRALDLYRRALPLVKNPKWRSIVKWWISRAQKKIRAAMKNGRLHGKGSSGRPLF